MLLNCFKESDFKNNDVHMCVFCRCLNAKSQNHFGQTERKADSKSAANEGSKAQFKAPRVHNVYKHKKSVSLFFTFTNFRGKDECTADLLTVIVVAAQLEVISKHAASKRRTDTYT